MQQGMKGLRTVSHNRKKTSKLNSMTEEEKAYWALILMAKYVQEATDWNEQEFINNIYKDYRFEKILGSSFLSVTQISGIYEAVSDLVLSLGYVGAIRALSNSEMRLLIEKLHNDFGIIFINRDSQNLREQFCAYYGLS